VFTDSDGWTVRTKDGSVSAHFEHDVCVRPDQANILSDYRPIEAAERNNPNLFTID
jgi:methionyl aminopeptidase